MEVNLKVSKLLWDHKVYGELDDVKEKVDIVEEGDEYEGEDCDELDPRITDDDVTGWITPSNSHSGAVIESHSTADISAAVACYTTDFSMQTNLQLRILRSTVKKNRVTVQFPLPQPKDGKNIVNLILCEDQRVPQQRLSKLALNKNNPMHPYYISGTFSGYSKVYVSTFVMREVSSRAAIMPANNKSDIKYWMRKNPNEVIK